VPNEWIPVRVVSPKARDESGRAFRVAIPNCTEELTHLTFFLPCETNVHGDKHRKHEERQERGPLEGEAEENGDEGDVRG